MHWLFAVPTLATQPGERVNADGLVYCSGVHLCYARRYGERWSAERPPVLIQTPDLWPLVESYCQGGRRVVLIAPNGAELLTLTGFWDFEADGLFRIREENPEIARSGKNKGEQKRPWVSRLVLAGNPTIVGARTAGGSLTVLSCGNYAEVSPEELCRATGVRAGEAQGRPAGGSLIVVEEDSECLAMARWFRRVVSEWVSERCGPWGDTAGALGLSVWRSTDGPKASRRHHNEEAKEVEAEALHGGRAFVGYYGSVGDRSRMPAAPADPPPEGAFPNLPGMAHKLDVKSAHAWILGKFPFPVQFKGITRDLTMEEFDAHLRHWGGIARVRLKVKEGEYPVKVGDRTRYPVGEFTTTLAHPELVAAHTRREVVSCSMYLRYQTGNPFAKWSRFVLDKRLSCKASGDHAGELLWKLIANSFGGKFAQRSRRWVMLPKENAPTRWGEYVTTAADSAVPLRRRAIAGIPYQLVEGSAGERLPASVFAYLTAYLRQHMRGIRMALGPGVVLSQDTDGLWVTDAGLKLASRVPSFSDAGPGSLHHETSVHYARWWDARRYYAGGEWTLAGIAGGWSLESTATVKETRRKEPTGFFLSPEGAHLIATERVKRLDTLEPDCPVGPDGWALPYGPDGSSLRPKAKAGDRGEGEVFEPKVRRKRRRSVESPLFD